MYAYLKHNSQKGLYEEFKFIAVSEYMFSDQLRHLSSS